MDGRKKNQKRKPLPVSLSFAMPTWTFIICLTKHRKLIMAHFPIGYISSIQTPPRGNTAFLLGCQVSLSYASNFFFLNYKGKWNYPQTQLWDPWPHWLIQERFTLCGCTTSEKMLFKWQNHTLNYLNIPWVLSGGSIIGIV